MVLGEEIAGADAPTPVDYALDQFATSLDHLVKVVEDGGLDYFDHSQFVTVMQGFERVRNTMALVDHRFLADATTRNLPEVLTQGTMVRTLISVLRLSPAEAPGGYGPRRRSGTGSACSDSRCSRSGRTWPQPNGAGRSPRAGDNH